MYGLVSTRLIPSLHKRLDVYQSKIFRKILKLDITYVNRANTNAKTCNQIQENMPAVGRNRKVKSVHGVYNLVKRKRALRIISRPESELFKANSKLPTWIHPKRR